jgi:glycosyltransferase involved in cell wall biosynthesis
MGSVDIIVPCYKYAHFLRECIESILTQEVDFRILIIDDASPDHTPEIAATLMAQDSRIEYRRHLINHGNIVTYNEGLMEWARSDYSVLLSADDMLTPGALLRAVRLMDEHPKVGFVYGHALLFRADQPRPKPRMASVQCPWQVRNGLEWLEDRYRRGGTGIYSPEIMVRTQLQKQLGGYFAELPHAGDTEMWLRFAIYADVGILDADQAFYRIHNESMSRQHFSTALANLSQQYAAFDRIRLSHGHRLANGDHLHKIATDVISRVALDYAYDSFLEYDKIHCRQLVEFAHTINPDVRSWRFYKHMKWQLLLGPHLWFLLRRIARRQPLCTYS